MPTPDLRGLLQGSEQVPERPQIEVEVAALEPEVPLQLLHPLGELHERVAEALDLLVGESPRLHPPQRLPLHQLSQQLHEREHELSEPPLDAFRIRVDPPGEGVADPIELAEQPVQVGAAGEDAIRFAHAATALAKLYGGQGPVQTTASSLCASSSSRTRSSNLSRAPV